VRSNVGGLFPADAHSGEVIEEMQITSCERFWPSRRSFSNTFSCPMFRGDGCDLLASRPFSYVVSYPHERSPWYWRQDDVSAAAPAMPWARSGSVGAALYPGGRGIMRGREFDRSMAAERVLKKVSKCAYACNSAFLRLT
jgi:hypothetical protein